MLESRPRIIENNTDGWSAQLLACDIPERHCEIRTATTCCIFNSQYGFIHARSVGRDSHCMYFTGGAIARIATQKSAGSCFKSMQKPANSAGSCIIRGTVGDTCRIFRQKTTQFLIVKIHYQNLEKWILIVNFHYQNFLIVNFHYQKNDSENSLSKLWKNDFW